MTRTIASVVGIALALSVAGRSEAHDGPPFPIVTDRHAGAYTVSIWTDPDTTDDGTPGGRFWVVLDADDGSALGDATRATITATPQSGPAAKQAALVTPTRDPRTRYGAVIMNREGPYRIELQVDGPRGTAAVSAAVDATYALRPSKVVALVYAVPFVLAGLLWIKLLQRNRVSRARLPALEAPLHHDGRP